jgi:hypothetical protein
LLQGSIIGAGPGTGIGKLTMLSPVILENFIFGQALFRTMSGTSLRSLLSCISFGICNHVMLTGTVMITNIGVAAGPPVGPIPVPAAPGIGKIV